MQTIQTSEGKILQTFKISPQHPKFYNNKVPLLFEIQSPDMQQPYLVTYEALRATKRDLLLQYFLNKTVLRQAHIQDLSQSMENHQYFGQAQEIKEILEIDNQNMQNQDLHARIQRMQDCFPIQPQKMHSRQDGKLRPKIIMVEGSGCYDLTVFSAKSEYQISANMIFDFDEVLEQIGIAPYCSHVCFQPICTKQQTTKSTAAERIKLLSQSKKCKLIDKRERRIDK